MTTKVFQFRAAQYNTRSLGVRLPFVRHAGRLHHLPGLVPRSTEGFKGYGTCVTSPSGRRPEKPKKLQDYAPRDGFEEYEHCRALLDMTIPTSDGELLRYIAGKVYDIIKSEFGPKPADQTWDRYLAPKLSDHGTWFNERGLGIGEMAVFIAVMKGRPDEVPQPQREAVEELVRWLGEEIEECENLWELVRS